MRLSQLLWGNSCHCGLTAYVNTLYNVFHCCEKRVLHILTEKPGEPVCAPFRLGTNVYFVGSCGKDRMVSILMLVILFYKYLSHHKLSLWHE